MASSPARFPEADGTRNGLSATPRSWAEVCNLDPPPTPEEVP
ncbi:hypothetical protein [Nocardiopsis rhodophaea]